MIVMDGIKTQLLNITENSGRFTPFYTAIHGQEQPTVGIISPKAVVMKTSILEPWGDFYAGSQQDFLVMGSL